LLEIDGEIEGQALKIKHPEKEARLYHSKSFDEAHNARNQQKPEKQGSSVRPEVQPEVLPEVLPEVEAIKITDSGELREAQYLISLESFVRPKRVGSWGAPVGPNGPWID
jgi:hypothetical protein